MDRRRFFVTGQPFTRNDKQTNLKVSWCWKFKEFYKAPVTKFYIYMVHLYDAVYARHFVVYARRFVVYALTLKAPMDHCAARGVKVLLMRTTSNYLSVAASYLILPLSS